MSSIDINISKSSYPQGHTIRQRYNYNSNVERNTLHWSRHLMQDGLIPITEVDSLLSYREIYRIKCNRFSLEKRELFNDFIEACEEFSTNKNVTYDHITGLDKYEYIVPIIDHLNLSKIPCQEDIYEPMPCLKKIVKPNEQMQQILSKKSKKNKKRSWKYYEAKKQAQIEAQYVVIDGNRYNSNYIYKRIAGSFVPIMMHPIQEIKYDDDEGILRSKTQTSKTSVTVTFPKDSAVNGIVLNPEPIKFEYVYDSRIRSGRRNTSRIRVMTNNPNYIQKFELYYRSSNTDGQWIKYGIFDGNTSIYDSIKIKFDEIIAKEIRIIPIVHTGSFEKVSVTSLMHMEKLCDGTEDDTITYTMYLPHRKFRHNYSREIDSIGGNCQSACGCYRCYGAIKGQMKARYREFTEQCDSLDFSC